MAIDYSEKIPNNVELAGDRTLQRALEHWQPRFVQWWSTMGPSDFAAADVYLRTAVGVDAAGWATYGQVRMPDYRWGIFLVPRDEKPAPFPLETTRTSLPGRKSPANTGLRYGA